MKPSVAELAGTASRNRDDRVDGAECIGRGGERADRLRFVLKVGHSKARAARAQRADEELAGRRASRDDEAPVTARCELSRGGGRDSGCARDHYGPAWLTHENSSTTTHSSLLNVVYTIARQFVAFGEDVTDLKKTWPTVPSIGHFDVVVVGSGSAGSSAAIAASRVGARVLLIEKLPFLGGHSTAVLDTFYGFYSPGSRPMASMVSRQSAVVSVRKAMAAIL